ncbi:regucalcin [Galendromus occidentalis]|uniref:Regucalcin n=1 Tax=Galendromus occidentalis TaxID=34638 RepID=A0AAJ6QYF5_9ACAR|nr:regucalcin [Galendromus occidentalis]
MTVRVLNSEKQDLGEGPHWLSGRNTLLIVDIEQKAVKMIDFVTGDIVERHTFDDLVGVAIPYASNANLLVVGVGNRLVKYDTETKKVLEVLCDVTEHEKGLATRINDAKCDPYGRIIFGTMPKALTDTLPASKGKLFSYSKGELKVLIEDVDLSNGLAWSRDNKTMFYVDSNPSKKMFAFDYDDTGALSNQRVLVDFNMEPFNKFGFPDGITIDVQDNIWLAVFGGSCILKIDSRTGKLLTKVNLPSMNVTSACFGGPDLSTLLVTSAGVHNVPTDLHEELGGRTFAVSDLGTKGRQPVEFAG